MGIPVHANDGLFVENFFSCYSSKKPAKPPTFPDHNRREQEIGIRLFVRLFLRLFFRLFPPVIGADFSRPTRALAHRESAGANLFEFSEHWEYRRGIIAGRSHREEISIIFSLQKI
jgi:hypothetical protein